jgi:hypothetical protein
LAKLKTQILFLEQMSRRCFCEGFSFMEVAM